MTKLLEHAIATARNLSPDMQDDLARLVLVFAGDDDRSPIELTDEDEAAVLRSRAEADRGDYASDADIRAIWAKHGL